MSADFLPHEPLLPALWAGHGFFAILFLQSGLDKVLNYKGQLKWIGEQFKDTILGSFTTPVFFVLTLLELASGLSSAACLYLLGTSDTGLSLPALMLCSITLLCLLFGQRISKDYQGSAGMAAYFVVCLISMLILHHLAM